MVGKSGILIYFLQILVIPSHQIYRQIRGVNQRASLSSPWIFGGSWWSGEPGDSRYGGGSREGKTRTHFTRLIVFQQGLMPGLPAGCRMLVSLWQQLVFISLAVFMTKVPFLSLRHPLRSWVGQGRWKQELQELAGHRNLLCLGPGYSRSLRGLWWIICWGENNHSQGFHLRRSLEEDSKGLCIICLGKCVVSAEIRGSTWRVDFVKFSDAFCLLRSLKTRIQRFNLCRKMELICF